jgi:hypothetical protein
MATRGTPDADSLRSLASVAPRAAIGDRGRSLKKNHLYYYESHH